MNKTVRKLITKLGGILLLTLLTNSCSQWMEDNGFMKQIENEVYVANADKITVFVRYPNTKMGTTSPSGDTTMKVGVPTAISSTTNTEYGFYKWAAFRKGTGVGQFDTSKQNSGLYFKNAEYYNNNYKKYEISSNIVSFENQNAEETSVTIYEKTNDIVIVPIVVERPYFTASVPANGKSEVVRNQTIRILMSKAVDASTLQENIKITCGTAVFTEDTEDTDALDITDKFDISLSKTGKMITCKLKPTDGTEKNLMDSKSQITVTLYTDITDTLGYMMEENQKIIFQTGSNVDSLSPFFISEPKAGINASAKEYAILGPVTSAENTENLFEKKAEDIESILNNHVGSQDAQTADTTYDFTKVCRNRVKDKINLWVQLADIAGAGANADRKDAVEDDVAFIKIATSQYTDNQGQLITDVPVKNVKIGYISGGIDSSYTGGATLDVAAGLGANEEKGTLFTYNLNEVVADDDSIYKYPDGLIRVNIWGVDMVGNEGNSEPYWKNYDNGVRTLFVVKDETPPEIDTSKITSLGEQVEGFATVSNNWYNPSTLRGIRIVANNDTAVVDAGAPNFSAYKKDLQWILKFNPETNWKPALEPDSSKWKPIYITSDPQNPNSVTDYQKYELTNVTGTKDGLVNIAVSAKDDLGNISAPVFLSSVYYDSVSPKANKLEWLTSTGTVGITKGNILKDQKLKITFTDDVAGVQFIKVKITKDDDVTTYATPFADSDFAIQYKDSTLVKNKDYTISNDTITFNVQNIENNSYLLTDSITLVNLKLADDIADATSLEGSYNVKVELTDAAQNKNDESEKVIGIANDSTKPVIEKIEIPGLKKAKELFKGINGAGTNDTWWLDHEYIGGTHNSDYAATKVPLYITINESNSGVNLITLGGKLKLQSTSTLWTVAEDGTETKVASSKYTIDTTANTIKINDYADSLKNSAGKSNFVILIKDLKATGIGGKSAVKNTVTVQVRDVALNESDVNSTIIQKGKTATLDGFYTDSLNCDMDKIEIADENINPVPATVGYTNDDHVTIYAVCGSEGEGTSGHNKFVFTGAKFTDESEVYFGTSGSSSSDALNCVKNSSSSNSRKLEATEYVISEDKTTIELRNADASEYYVFRANMALKVTNMQLDDVATDGSKTVKAQAFDLAGWNESENIKSSSIILDKTKPEWHFEEGTFAAPSGKVNGTFIYPHPNGDTAYGIPSTADEKNKDGEIVRYYYTASKVSDTGDYGVIVGIGGKDANLRGYVEKKGVPYYICDTTSVSLDVIDANYVLTHGSMPSTDCNGNTTGNDSEWKTAFNGWENMEPGHTYSIVIVDEAGNYSEKAKTIKIVKDTTKPSVKLDGSNSLSEVFTLDIPDRARVFRNQILSQDTYTTSESENNLYDSGEHSSTEYYSTNYVIKETSDDYKIVVKLNGRKTGDTMLDGTSASSDTSAYTEKTPTATDSGLAYYAVSHWYADWCTSSDDASNYYPAFPSENSNVPNGSSIIQYMEYTGILEDDIPTGLTSKCSWHPYAEGNYTDTNTNPFDTINSSVDSDGNISISIPKTEKTPPLALLLKDNCGNMNYILIRPKSMETDQKQTISYIVDNKLGGSEGHCETEDGITKERAVLINPGIDKNGTGATVGTHTFAWGNQSSSFITSAAHGGVSVTGRLVKNLVTNTTYYNDNAWLCLSVEGGESILFDINGPTTNTTQYTGRAKLYLSKTELSDSEAYATISQASTENGIATDWNYYACSSDSDIMHFVFQYPHPDYEALDWASNEPFYIYYLVEDYVGNYDIHKVVNDDSDKMDKWVYDNVAPVLTLVDGTEATKSGDYYLFNPADISKLLPENNGYGAYTDGSNIYVSMGFDDNHLKPRTGATQNSSVGEGTTRHVETSTDTAEESRKNLMFYDIKVASEASGIRAFCYSTDATSPGISTPVSEKNTQGDKGGVWYEGFGAENIHAEIGCDWTYSTDNTNRYDTSEIYKTSAGEYKYSGTKINTIVPHSLINGSTSLYLHVMDWVGNISTYKMGDINYVNDATIPGDDGKTDTNIYKDDHNITSYDNTSHDLQYTFAATKIPSDVTSLKIYMPEGKYSDDAGSGLLGWSLTPNDLNDVKKDEKGSYIEIKGSELNRIIKGEAVEEPISVYVYDNVGNCSDVKLKFVGDKEPNEFTIFVRPGDTNKLFYVKDSSSASSENQNTGSESSGTEITSLSEITAEAYTNDTKVTYLAQFKDKKPADDLRTLSIDRYTGSETETYDATMWTNLQKWETGNTYTDWFYSNPHKDGYYYLNNEFVSTDSKYLYYRLVTQDKAGNTNYAYIKVATDTTAPTVTLVEGSITGVNNVDGTNYFNSNSKAKLKYADTGSGLKSYTGVDSVTDYVKETEEIEVNLGELTPSSGKLIFTSTDNLGNDGSTNLTYNESETWVKDITAPVTTNVTKQSIVNKSKTNSTYTTVKSDNSQFGMSNSTRNKTASIYVIPVNTDDNTKYEANIVVNSQVNRFYFYPNATDDNLYGWKVTASPLTQDWFEIGTDDGVIQIGSNGYAFARSDKNLQCNEPIPSKDNSRYFYPIDKAGNIGTPIVLNFIDAPFPAITQIEKKNFSNGYYNENSSVDISVKYGWGSEKITIKQVGISDELDNSKTVDLTTPVELANSSATAVIQDISLSGITGSTIEFELITDLTSSQDDDNSKLTSVTYDNAGPTDVKVSDVKDQTDSSQYVIKGDDTKVIFGSKATTLKVTFTATDAAEIEGFATSDTAETWSDTVEFSSPTDGTKTVYAKDKLGNVSSGTLITFENDASVSDVTSLTFSSPDSGNGIYFDSTNKKLYYNTTSIKVTPATTDIDIDYFYYNDVINKSAEDNSFTITPADGDYTFYAVDKLGNVSSTGYTVTFEKDDSIATSANGTIKWYKDSEEVTDSSYVYNEENTQKYYFNSSKINKFEFIPDTNDASGIVGFATSNTSTEWKDSVSVDVTTNTTIEIYAKDNVGNVGKVVSFTLIPVATVKSTTDPESVGYTGNTSIDSTIKGFKGHSIVASDGTTAVTLLTGHDNQIGDGYVTNLYPAGSKVVLPITVGTPKVSYVIKGGNTAAACETPADGDYTEVELTEGKLTVDMPNLSDYHSFIFVFLKDQVGNTAVYNIGNPSDPTQNWMCEYKDISTTSSSAAIVQDAGGTSRTLYLSGLSVQSPIKSIYLKGDNIGSDKTFTVNAYYEKQSGSSKTVTYSAAYGATGSADEYNPTFTFKDNSANALNYIAGGERIEIVIPESSEKTVDVTEIIITDCSDKTVTINSIGKTANDIPSFNSSRRGMFSGIAKVAENVSVGVKKVFTTRTLKENTVMKNYRSVKNPNNADSSKVEVKEIPVEVIAEIPNFESIDVESALENSFAAGTISKYSKMEETIKNSEKNNQKLVENSESVAPLFASTGINTDINKVEEEVSSERVNIYVEILTVVCIIIVIVSFFAFILKKLKREKDIIND